VGVLAAVGMAARRWYLLIPLMAASGGVAWFAYTQMPASYAATAVYQVSTSTASEAKTISKSRGLSLASPKTPQDPLAVAKSAATDLVESVHPQPPAGPVPGRPTAQPVTIQLQPGTPVITVRAVADSAAHARDAVTATTTQLTDRLHGIAEEQRALAGTQLTLDAMSPMAFAPPERTVGRRVGIATLAFCLALSVLLAAAVERSARRRRLLAAQAARAEEDERDGALPDDVPVSDEALAGDTSRSSGGDRAAALVSAVEGSRPAWASGPVRTVTSARPAAPVRADADEDDTAVIFSRPADRTAPPARTSAPHRSPAPAGSAGPARSSAAGSARSAAAAGSARSAAPAGSARSAAAAGSARPARSPQREGAPKPTPPERCGPAAPQRPAAARPSGPPEPHRPLAAETPARQPRPPAPQGRPLPQGGRVTMPPRRPRDTEAPTPAALSATGGNPPPLPGLGAGAVPGRPRRPKSSSPVPQLLDPPRSDDGLGGSGRSRPGAPDPLSPDPLSRDSLSHDPGAIPLAASASSLEPTLLEPTPLESTVLEPAVLDPTALGRTSLDRDLLEPGPVERDLLEPGPVERGLLEPGPVERSLLEPAALHQDLLEPAVLGPGPLEPVALEPTSAEPASRDLGALGTGPGPESIDSSALWLPVADLPGETDGWLPSLAPDIETSTGARAGDDIVSPVHTGPPTSGYGAPSSPTSGFPGAMVSDRDGEPRSGPAAGPHDDGLPDVETYRDELPGHELPGDELPGDGSLGDEPTDRPSEEQPPPDGAPADGPAGAAAAQDAPDHDAQAEGPPDPVEKAVAVEPDDEGELEGWPEFDEQVRA